MEKGGQMDRKKKSIISILEILIVIGIVTAIMIAREPDSGKIQSNQKITESIEMSIQEADITREKETLPERQTEEKTSNNIKYDANLQIEENSQENVIDVQEAFESETSEGVGKEKDSKANNEKDTVGKEDLESTTELWGEFY